MTRSGARRRAGKKPEPKVALPDGWWGRLNDLCKSKWSHNDGTKPSYFDIYEFTKIARGTFSTARKTNQLTERTLETLTENTGFESRDDLLRALAPPASAEANEQARTRKELRAKIKLAQDFLRQEKHDEGRQLLRETLVLAESSGLDVEEVEVLLTLALLSKPRRGEGDRRAYLSRASLKIDSVSDPILRAHYFRVVAADHRDDRNLAEAEVALRSALACCEGDTTSKPRRVDAQTCSIQSDLIVLLCEQDRNQEAEPLLLACEAIARNHIDDEDAEFMQSAMSAGIFWAVKSGVEGGAIDRIVELEKAGKTSQQALRISRQLVNIANNVSHMRLARVAAAAADSAVRLARKTDDDATLLAALYAVAVVAFHAGDELAAKRKAEAILQACKDPEHAVIAQLARHLIAEVLRGQGDAGAAVKHVTEALAASVGRPEEVAFTKQAAARALSDNGRTEEALAHALEALELMNAAGAPSRVVAGILFQVVSYASVLGRELESSEALRLLDALEDDERIHPDEDDLATTKSRAAKLAERQLGLRERIAAIGNDDDDSARSSNEEAPSLADANAKVVKPLITAWTEISVEHLGTAATAYDFWGRGNFARIIRNAKTFTEAFNVTLEVRTVDELKQAVRLWCFYADTILLLWKGPTEDGKLLDMVPESICDGPGGAGYILSGGDEDASGRPKLFCVGTASRLPPEVMLFLMTDASPMVTAGRLLVVPAVSVGCVHPGHGPLEQLLAESANAIAGIRSSEGSNEMPIGLLPYSPDAPFELLSDIIGAHEEELRKLRRLLVRRTRELAPQEAGVLASKELALEIGDRLRSLESRQRTIARKHGSTHANEPVNGGLCRFVRDGRRLSPDSSTTGSPFAPLLTLQNFGFKWSVGLPGSRLPGRFSPGKGSVIGPWLAPSSAGWYMAFAQKDD